MHAPQAPYFSSGWATKGSYLDVHKDIGSEIDLYLIQYYNQGVCSFDTYETLFLKTASGCWSPRTAVRELIDLGIPSQKIVVGKPSTPKDATNTGYVNPSSLG